MVALKKSLAVVLQAAQTYYGALYQMLLMGIVTMLAFLVVIPGPPALAALCEIARRLTRDKTVTWGDYGDALKTYALKAWGLWLVALLISVLLAGNLWFYTAPISPIPFEIGQWIRVGWGAITLIWIGVLFYAGTFLVALETPRIWVALRSSLFLTLLHPVPTLIWVLIASALLVISFFVPVLFIFTPALISLISARGMRALTAPIFNEVASDEEDVT